MTNQISFPDWKPRQVVLGTVYIVLVIAAFLLLLRFRNVIFILFVAIVISTAISPAVNFLSRRGLSRALSAALVFLIVFGLLGGFFALSTPMIVKEGATVSTALPDYYTSLRGILVNSPSYLLRRLGYELPYSVSIGIPSAAEPAQTEEAVTEQILQQAAQVFRFTGLAARGIFSTVAVFLLAFYWTLDGERTTRALLMLLPTTRRDAVRETIEEVQSRLGAYVIGQLFLCLVIGVLSLIAYLLIGLPNAFLLALIAGIMEAVPVFGPTLGAVPAILMAVASNEPAKIVWIIIASVVIQGFENNLLVPRVGKSVGVNPIVTLLALAAFTSLFGLAGAILAIPLAAVFQLIANRLLLERTVNTVDEPEGRDLASAIRLDVKELSNDVRKYVRDKDAEVDSEQDQVEDSIEQIADQLDQILMQSATRLPEGIAKG